MKNLTLLGLVFLLTACVPSNPTPESPATTETNPKAEELYAYWPSQGQAQIIYQVRTDTDDAFQVQYPVITNLPPNHPVAVAVNQSLQADLETFKTEASTFFDDSEEGLAAGIAIPWDYTIEWLGGRYDRQLWSLALQIYTYHGGAHGTSYTHTINYSPRENKLLNLADFFTDDAYQVPLFEALKSELIKAKTERWQASGQTEEYDPGLDENLKILSFSEELTNAWVVSQQNNELGFLFFLAPYEVGAYSEGAYEVFVPVSVVSEFLKAEFKGVFE